MDSGCGRERFVQARGAMSVGPAELTFRMPILQRAFTIGRENKAEMKTDRRCPLRLGRFLTAMVLAGLALSACRSRTAVPAPTDGEAASPRLVLFVVVDQLRPDILSQIRPRFGPEGFRRIMDQGIWYAEARCGHFPTLTAVGHAVLFTGAQTAEHGIAANDWADPETGDRVYCLEDPGHAILGRKPKAHEGVSPRLLTSTTFGDEIVLSSGGRSRVFAVSLKNRAAILAASRMGKAFWFASDTGEFVTSTFYYDAYPSWVAAWNASRKADRYRGGQWRLAGERGRYLRIDDDDRAAEKGPRNLGTTFPHSLAPAPGPDLYDQLTYTPFGDELTVEFAETLLENEALGRGDAPDVLAVGLSATDYIGHYFGPASLEYEDQVLRLDALLTRLFAAADRSAGRDRVLIVLASDHGVDEIPEARAALGFESGRLDAAEIQARMNEHLRARFKIGFDPVTGFWTPAFFLDVRAITRAGLKVEDVESAAAGYLAKEPGVAWALTRNDLLAGRIPDAPILAAVRSSVHPERTGRIILVQKPHWYLYDDATLWASTHGSPYAYDVRVPLGWNGRALAARVVLRPVSLFDVAPTIAAILEIAPPSGSTGTPLTECLTPSDARVVSQAAGLRARRPSFPGAGGTPNRKAI